MEFPQCGLDQIALPRASSRTTRARLTRLSQLAGFLKKIAGAEIQNPPQNRHFHPSKIAFLRCVQTSALPIPFEPAKIQG